MVVDCTFKVRLYPGKQINKEGLVAGGCSLTESAVSLCDHWS